MYKAMNNQLIDEALSLYNYLRIHGFKVLTDSDDRMRLDNLITRAFYRYERRKKKKRLVKWKAFLRCKAEKYQNAKSAIRLMHGNQRLDINIPIPPLTLKLR
jgi:hypothetical protein